MDENQSSQIEEKTGNGTEERQNRSVTDMLEESFFPIHQAEHTKLKK